MGKGGEGGGGGRTKHSAVRASWSLKSNCGVLEKSDYMGVLKTLQ